MEDYDLIILAIIDKCFGFLNYEYGGKNMHLKYSESQIRRYQISENIS